MGVGILGSSLGCMLCITLLTKLCTYGIASPSLPKIGQDHSSPLHPSPLLSPLPRMLEGHYNGKLHTSIHLKVWDYCDVYTVVPQSKHCLNDLSYKCI